jgi:hypothetical protein
MEKIIHKGKEVTLDNITLEDIEELFEFDKTILLNHRLRLGQEYIDTHFPENQKLFNKVQQAIKRSIKLTDPKTYKDVKDPQTVYKLLSVDHVNKHERPKRKLKLQSRNKKTAARFLKKPKKNGKRNWPKAK